MWGGLHVWRRGDDCLLKSDKRNPSCESSLSCMHTVIQHACKHFEGSVSGIYHVGNSS